MEAILAAVLGFAILAAVVAGVAKLLMRWLQLDAVSAAVVATILVLGLGMAYLYAAMVLDRAA